MPLSTNQQWLRLVFLGCRHVFYQGKRNNSARNQKRVSWIFAPPPGGCWKAVAGAFFCGKQSNTTCFYCRELIANAAAAQSKKLWTSATVVNSTVALCCKKTIATEYRLLDDLFFDTPSSSRNLLFVASLYKHMHRVFFFKMLDLEKRSVFVVIVSICSGTV